MDNFAWLKLLTDCATPLGLALLLALLGVIIARRWLVLLALAWLWVWSTPWAAQQLAYMLEQPYPLMAAAELPKADVIVVLGGGLFPGAPGWHPEHNLTDAGDRLIFAEKLYALHKAPRLLYTGGPMHADGRSEARAGSALMQELGMPAAVFTIEPNSRTTRENAEFSMPLLQTMGARRALLVTSVWHMQRAMSNFREAAQRSGAAIEFIPAACDPVEFPDWPIGLMRYTPKTEALDISRRLFKEWLGLAYARLGMR